MRNHRWHLNKCMTCGVEKKADFGRDKGYPELIWSYSYDGKSWVNERPDCKESIRQDCLSIIQTVNNYFGVDVMQKGKKGQRAFARQVAATLLHTFTTMTCSEIGRLLGTDHTTAMYSKKKIWSLCKYYPEIRRQVIELETLIE